MTCFGLHTGHVLVRRVSCLRCGLARSRLFLRRALGRKFLALLLLGRSAHWHLHGHLLGRILRGMLGVLSSRRRGDNGKADGYSKPDARHCTF